MAEAQPDWNKLFDELREAKKAFEEAERASSSARSRETDCLNRVNRAQAAINSAMLKEKALAPRSTDWATESRRGGTNG